MGPFHDGASMDVARQQSFGEQIRVFRRRAGLTQEELAERAGLSVRGLSDLERGTKTHPRAYTVRQLAAALDLSDEERVDFLALGMGIDPTLPPAPGSVMTTFLIADVRGYTQFTVDHGDEAAAALTDRFAALTEGIVSAHAGQILELRGDEALCLFPSAQDSLHAAVALQHAFKQAVAEDPSLPLPVGIGLDAGDAVPVRGGFRGGALNLAARLCSLAAPGEVFCSEGVIHLARTTEGIAVVDRGEVLLKGLAAPIRVLQIARDGELPQTLPPLQPLLVTRPTNLPDEPTPFIGREREIAQVASLFRDPHIRLVTLTGPGGSGKTRLALQVGTTLLHDFRDGVFFVNLASLSDPSLVASSIAAVLQVKDAPGRDLLSTLAAVLQDRHLLLVLDNYEHLLDAAPLVSSLLDACRELHVLVTSRIPLHLAREQEYPVPPLSLPDPSHLPELDALSQYEAVALFIDRARAIHPGFQVTNENAPAVAEICVQLDGLPLALELAAARTRIFPPQALLQRLNRRLVLLTGGAKDRPTRQQTLRGAIDWSYSLLSGEEQIVFARLSVFAGGCSLEAAEAVCDPQGELDVLEGVGSLVDKSLVKQVGETEPRFSMLETIREYAAERLEERGEKDLLAERLASYILDLVGEAEPPAAERDRWHTRLEADLDNIRSCLDWAIERRQPQVGLRVLETIGSFWTVRGRVRERRSRTIRLLDVPGEVDPRLRLAALTGIAGGAWHFGIPAEPYLEEARRIARDLGDPRLEAKVLDAESSYAYRIGDLDRAEALAEECISLTRLGGGATSFNDPSMLLGIIEMLRGNLERAGSLQEEALRNDLERQNWHSATLTLSNLANVALRQGQLSHARKRILECVEMSVKAGYWAAPAYLLDVMSGIAVAEGLTELGGIMLGASRADRIQYSRTADPEEQIVIDEAERAGREAIGADAWEQALARGSALAPEDRAALISQFAASEPVPNASRSLAQKAPE